MRMHLALVHVLVCVRVHACERACRCLHSVLACCAMPGAESRSKCHALCAVCHGTCRHIFCTLHTCLHTYLHAFLFDEFTETWHICMHIAEAHCPSGQLSKVRANIRETEMPDSGCSRCPCAVALAATCLGREEAAPRARRLLSHRALNCVCSPQLILPEPFGILLPRHEATTVHGLCLSPPSVSCVPTPIGTSATCPGGFQLRRKAATDVAHWNLPWLMPLILIRAPASQQRNSLDREAYSAAVAALPSCWWR